MSERIEPDIELSIRAISVALGMDYELTADVLLYRKLKVDSATPKELWETYLNGRGDCEQFEFLGPFDHFIRENSKGRFLVATGNRVIAVVNGVALEGVTPDMPLSNAWTVRTSYFGP